MIWFIILWIIVGIIAIIGLLYVINETNFLYDEPVEYVEPDLSKLMHKNAAPIYHLNGNKKAIMFVHGFTANPNEFLYFADKSKDVGFDVIVPLQPGAGTSKEDFKKTYFSQWYNCIKDNYLKYRSNYDKFFVVGLSMGGAITLKLSEEFSSSKDKAPTGVVTMAAPVFLNSLFENGILYNPLLYFSRVASWFVTEMPPTDEKHTEDGADRSISYAGTFTKQIHSLKMALKKIKKNLHKITIPIFLSHSKGDLTVPFENIYYIMKRLSSKKVKAKVFDIRQYNHSRHVLPIYDSTRDDLFKEIMYFVNEL